MFIGAIGMMGNIISVAVFLRLDNKYMQIADHLEGRLGQYTNGKLYVQQF